MLNEAGLKIEGVYVDINPIKEDKTGTLETYLPQVEQYLTEKAEQMQDKAEFEKPEKERHALDHSDVTITYVVSSNGEFHDMGAYRDDITSVDEAIAVFNEHHNTKVMGDITRALLYIDDVDMIELSLQAVEKLKALSDEEFAAMSFEMAE